MILPAQEIRRLCFINPFCERTRSHGMSYGLSAAGYDIRVKQELNLIPGVFYLASTVEYFNMPLDVMGIVHDKSTLARMGMAVQNTVIEPGWAGFLTLEITNHGPHVIRLEEGSPVAQIVFHRLETATDQPYEGKYQHQEDRPVPAILEK